MGGRMGRHFALRIPNSALPRLRIPHSAGGQGVGAVLVSIVSTPPAGRLEGGSDRPEFQAIRPETSSAVTHCKSVTCRSVTWKD